MPVGNPSAQSRATRKYEKKAGWVSKSYKLRKKLVDEFAEACSKQNVSQAAQLSKMMQEFIDSTK